MAIDLLEARARAGEDALLERLSRLNEIGIALSSERSLERLLRRILFEARAFARAEAGTLYVRDGDALAFAVVQNDRLPQQRAPTGRLPITRSSIAGFVATTAQVLNLPDVRALPPDAEFTFNRSFDESTGFETRSMLVVPMLDPKGAVNGVIQLINAVDQVTGAVGPFPDWMEPLCQSLASQAAVALTNAQLTERLERAHEEAIFLLSRAAEYRDSDTGEHIRRVACYSEVVANALGLEPERARALRLASPMHDIGKIHIPDAVLKKPGKLDPDERREIERHTSYGDQILAPSTAPLLQLARQVAKTHHERWDGKGYPEGLAAEEIPLVGRITAVVDVFDALTSARCYKPAMPVEQACAILQKDAGTHFDPAVVDAFLRVLPQILEIRARYQDDGAG